VPPLSALAGSRYLLASTMGNGTERKGNKGLEQFPYRASEPPHYWRPRLPILELSLSYVSGLQGRPRFVPKSNYSLPEESSRHFAIDERCVSNLFFPILAWDVARRYAGLSRGCGPLIRCGRRDRLRRIGDGAGLLQELEGGVEPRWP
jgi:hypothetical protein